jgi:hypothetical protein
MSNEMSDVSWTYFDNHWWQWPHYSFPRRHYVEILCLFLYGLKLYFVLTWHVLV